MKKTSLFLAVCIILILAATMSSCGLVSSGERFEGFRLQVTTLKERYELNESVILQIIETSGSPQGYNVYKKIDDEAFSSWKKEISAEDSFTLNFPQFGTYTIKIVAVTDNVEQSANSVSAEFFVSDPIPVENILIKNNVVDLYYGDSAANSFELKDLEIVYFPTNASEKGLSYLNTYSGDSNIGVNNVIQAKGYAPNHEPYVIPISSTDNGRAVANLYIRINNSRLKYALTDFFVGYVDRVNESGWIKRVYTYGDWVNFQCIEYAGMQKADSYEAAIKVGENYVALGASDFKIETEQGITFYKIKMPEQSGYAEYLFRAIIDGTPSQTVTKTVRVEVAAPPVQATAITLEDDEVTLLLNQTNYAITHTIAPSNTADKSVTYEIEEGGEDYIGINANGVVTPIAATQSPVSVTVRSNSNPEVFAETEISVSALTMQEVVTHSKPLTQPIQTAENIVFSLNTELEEISGIKWYKDNVLQAQTTEYTYAINPPATAGTHSVKAEVNLGGAPIIIEMTVTLESCFEILGLAEEYELNSEVELEYETALADTQVMWAVYPVGGDVSNLPSNTYTFSASGDYRIQATLSYNGVPVESKLSDIISIKDNVTHELYDVSVNGYFDGTNYAPFISWHKLKWDVLYTVEIKKGAQTFIYNSSEHSDSFALDGFRVPYEDVTLADSFDYRIKTDISNIYTGFRSYGTENNNEIITARYSYLNIIPLTEMNRYITSVAQLAEVLNYIKVFRPTDLYDGEKYVVDLYFAIDYETDVEQERYERNGDITTNQTEEPFINAGKLVAAANNAYGEGPKTSMLFTAAPDGGVRISLAPDEPEDINEGSTYNNENDELIYAPRYSDSPSDSDRAPNNEPVLNNTRTLAVSTSSQLYLAALWGYRPIPTAESVAEEIYNEARAILNEIITLQMSDSEKALVIYDWLTINVAYDDDLYDSYMAQMAAAETQAERDAINLAMSRKQSFHLEGAILNKIAVCDGISKAFTLLCSIEELAVIRLSGAGNSGNGEVNHAWNAIMLEGSWYYVDATWGRSPLTYGEIFLVSPNHYYFLATDDDMESTHTFDGEAPVVASERSYYFFDNNDEPIDLYFETEDEFDEFISQIPTLGNVCEEFVIAYEYSGTLNAYVESRLAQGNIIINGNIVKYVIIRGFDD